MLDEVLCYFSRCLAYVAQMRFDVDCALIPECQAIVVDDLEGVLREVFGRVRGGLATDMVAIICDLEYFGGMVFERLLEEHLRGFRLQRPDVGVFKYRREVDI